MFDVRSLVLALAPAFLAPAVDLAPVLRSLDATDAVERARAERWLVEHLLPSDQADLRAGLSAVDLGPEATWRLSRALGSRSSNLGLILDLIVGAGARPGTVSLDLEILGDDDAPTRRSLERELGRRALEHLLATWRSDLDRLPLSGAALAPMLLEERERHDWHPLEIEDGPVAEVLARIVHQGDLPIPVVMSQGLSNKLVAERFGGPFTRRPTPFTGPWDQVLLAFARAHDLAFEAVLHRGEEGAQEFAWLRLVEREAAGTESGTLQLMRALEDVARHVRAEDRGDMDAFTPSISTGELQLAARFLAGVGYDGALGWLGDLWADEGAAIARTALLEGAARGFVEPRLATADGLAELWTWARDIARRRDAGGAHLERMGAALAHLPRYGADGSDLAAVCFEELGPDDDVRAWSALARLRFQAADAMGVLPAAGVALAQDILARDTGEGLDWAQIAALRALRHVDGARPELPELRWERIYGWVPGYIEPEELAVLLSANGLVPRVVTADGAAPALRDWRPDEVQLIVSTCLLTDALPAGMEAELGFGPDGDPAAKPTPALVAALFVGGGRARGGLDMVDFGAWRRVLGNARERERFDAVAASVRQAYAGGHAVAVLDFFAGLAGLSLARDMDASEADRARIDDQPHGPPLYFRLALVTGLALRDQDQLARLAGVEPGTPAATIRRLDYPFLDDLQAEGDASYLAGDLEALALLSGSTDPKAELAKERFLDLFEAELETEGYDPAMLAALELAVHSRWSRGLDAEAEALVLEIAMLAASHSSHPLARRILFQPWPPPVR